MSDRAGDPVDVAERAVARMEVALRRTGPQDPFPPAVAALFAVALPPVGPLDDAGSARLAAVIARIGTVRDELQARQRRVAGRLQAVQAALGRSGPRIPHVDEGL